jgi:hypothetical protein
VKRTCMVFILDETGSMAPVKTKTLSGINEFIKSQDNPALGVCNMTLIKFNSGGINTVFENKLISDVPALTEEDYKPAFVTPLYDAVAYGIRKAEAMVKLQNDVIEHLSGSPNPDKPLVLIAIMTDGMENASQETKLSDLNALVSKKQAAGWTFAFLGCDQDSWMAAGNMGIPVGNRAMYASGSPEQGFTKYSNGTSALRASYACGQTDGMGTNNFFAANDQAKDLIDQNEILEKLRNQTLPLKKSETK